MWLIILAVCLCLSHANNDFYGDHFIPLEAQVLKDRELVDYVNANQKLFTAKLAPAEHGLHRKLMKLQFIDQNHKPVHVDEGLFGSDIPESFDARKVWPGCPSLNYIRDQSNCGSCWAVSSAEAMSDRLCIASKGKTKVEISADELVSCCYNCGYGCEGGWPIRAWQYFAKNGLVTGGDYGTKDACRPYEIPPCGHHLNETYYGECTEDAETPKCVRHCQKGYSVPYNKDKKFGKTAYALPNSVKAIQRDIMKNGPVIAGFTVYADFAHYSKGIYKHTAGGIEGGHAVKIIGWGKENGTPYWIIANSWNRDWGENGFFRMIRGKNDCGIEENVVAGLV